MTSMTEALESRAKNERKDRRSARRLTGLASVGNLATAAFLIKDEIDFTKVYNHALALMQASPEMYHYATEIANKATSFDFGNFIFSGAATLFLGLRAAYKHGSNRRNQPNYYNRR